MLRLFRNWAGADHELIESFPEELKGMAPSSVRSRRSDLVKAGYLGGNGSDDEYVIVSTTPSGRDAINWRLTPKGHKFLDRLDGQA